MKSVRTALVKFVFLIAIFAGIFGIAGCKESTTGYNTPVPIAQNINFVGDQDDRVYHKLNCKLAPSSDKAVGFDSPTAASYSGYKPCKACHPDQP